MSSQYLPALIEITDPNCPPDGILKIAEINDKLNYPDEIYSFFQQGEHLSIVHHWIITPKNKAPYLTTDQFDAPLAILPWFVNKLEFFIKPSSQGGLPPNKIATDKDPIAGENLILGRLVDAGNARRDGGYDITNLQRKDHAPISNSYQTISFSDSFLFQGGLLELWKELANKYENGTL
ncbi:hypothetical protein [Thalassotalea ganghwensis]